MCLCPHSKNGQFCEIANLKTIAKSTILLDNDPGKTRATEFKLFTTQLPIKVYFNFKFLYS